MRAHRLDTRIGGHPRYVYCHEWELMQVPPELLKCVCFVEVKQGASWRLNGTAFLVSVPLEGVHPAVEPEPRAIYAVTAKHVLYLEGGNVDPDDPWWYDDARLVLNVRGGGIDRLPVPPSAWAHHPYSDTSVVAVDIDLAHFDCMHYPAASYVERDFFTGHQITPGERVLVAGLLWAHPGTSQISPIVRVGHLAGFPLDRVELDTGKEGVLLVEVLSFGGLSGSPAFLHLGDFRREQWGRGELLALDGEAGMNGNNWLLGIVHGWFGDDRQRSGIPPEPLNVGITAVIPAARIAELLHTFEDERIEMAKKANERAPKPRPARVPVPDPENAEYTRFDTLARKLVNTPKQSATAERSGSTDE